MSEQRKLVRKRSYLAAYVTAGASADAVFCMVRDLSGRGGKLEIPSVQPLPDCFDLHIAGREQPFRVAVKWRSATSVGVRFLPR